MQTHADVALVGGRTRERQGEREREVVTRWQQRWRQGDAIGGACYSPVKTPSTNNHTRQ